MTPSRWSEIHVSASTPLATLNPSGLSYRSVGIPLPACPPDVAEVAKARTMRSPLQAVLRFIRRRVLIWLPTPTLSKAKNALELPHTGARFCDWCSKQAREGALAAGRHPVVQPRFGDGPVAFDGSPGHLECGRGFLDGEPAEKLELDDAAQAGVKRRQLIERFI